MWLQENFSRVIFYFYFLLPLGWFLSVGSSFAPSRVDSLRLFKTQAQQHLSALPSWAHRGAVRPSPPRPSSTRLGPPWPFATLRCLRVSRRPGRRPSCRAAFLPLPEPLPFSGDARPTLAGLAGTCSPPLQMCFSFAHDWAQDSVLLFTFIHNSDSAPVTNIRRAPFTESNSNISSRPKFSSWDSRELCMWLINEHLKYGEINPGRSGRRRPPRVALPFVTFCSFLRCSVPVSVTRG